MRRLVAGGPALSIAWSVRALICPRRPHACLIQMVARFRKPEAAFA
jgi:hypothetical protein